MKRDREEGKGEGQRKGKIGKTVGQRIREQGETGKMMWQRVETGGGRKESGA